MIPLEITLLIFFILGLLIKSKTYFILAIFAWLNIYIDQFTTSEDVYLMLTYTSIDFFAALAVLFFGDIHKTYQSFILATMIFVHCLMEMALVNDYVNLIESAFYINAITVLLVAQMTGGFYGIFRLLNPLYGSNPDIWKAGSFDIFNSKTRN